MGTKETSQWEGWLTYRAGNTENKTVPSPAACEGRALVNIMMAFPNLGLSGMKRNEPGLGAVMV